MFACTKDEALDSLRTMGRGRCVYAGEWPLNRCDCKYGGPKTEGPLSYLGEQNGCPELRTIYTIVASITDAEWADLMRRGGMVNPRDLFDADEEVADDER